MRQTLRPSHLIKLLAGGCVAIVLGASPVMAGTLAPPSAEDDDGPQDRRHITDSDSYVRMPAVRTPVRSGRRTAGMLQVSLALDAPRSRSRALIAEREVLLRSVYSETLLIYAARLYTWGDIPDADLISELLQGDTDRLLGEGRATVVLDTVMLHAH